MTDKQQFETIATELSNSNERNGLNLCESEVDLLAIDLCDAGYRRVGKNEVVLEQVDYYNLVDRAEYAEWELALWYKSKDKIRKETAKEIINEIKRKYGKSCSEYYPLLIEITSEELDDLAKQFGVEVE